MVGQTKDPPYIIPPKPKEAEDVVKYALRMCHYVLPFLCDRRAHPVVPALSAMRTRPAKANPLLVRAHLPPLTMCGCVLVCRCPRSRTPTQTQTVQFQQQQSALCRAK